MCKGKKILKLSVVILTVILLFTACQGERGSEGAKVLRLATTEVSNSLNNLKTAEGVNLNIIRNYIERLVEKDMGNKIVPSLAEKWTVSEDGMVYTFFLRDAKWANGESVRAQDFVFGFQTVATLEDAGYGDRFELLKNGKEVRNGTKSVEDLGVKAIDDKTFEITLEKPLAYFLEVLATIPFDPLNKKFYETVGADKYGTSPETVLANGPYVLKEYEGSSKYVLEKNVNYWNASSVSVDRVEMNIIPQPETQAVMYNNNELDALDLTADLIDRYQGEQNMHQIGEARIAYWFAGGQSKTPSNLLANKNFRGALAHAFDKAKITDMIMKDGSTPADYLVPKKFAFVNNQDFRTFSGVNNNLYYNPEQAKAYLEQAKKELGNEPLTFTLETFDQETNKKIMENLVFQIENTLPEVKIKLSFQPRSTYYPMLFKFSTPSGQAGWGADIEDPYDFLGMFTSESGLNLPQYRNPEYDAMIEKAQSAEFALQPEKRFEMLRDAEKILLDDFVIMPLYQKGHTQLISPKVKGLITDVHTKNVRYKYVTID